MTVTAPPIPKWVKFAGPAAILALLILAAWLGSSLATPAKQTPASWALQAPLKVNNWVRGSLETLPPVSGTNRVVVSTNYANGSAKLTLLLSRPEQDITSYLADAKITDIEQVGDSSCGISADTKKSVCVRIVDSTAILLLGASDQKPNELADLVDEFYTALAN